MTRRITTTIEDDLYRVLKAKKITFAECLAKGAELILNDSEAPVPSLRRIGLTQSAIDNMTEADKRKLLGIIRRNGCTDSTRKRIFKFVEKLVGLPLNPRSRTIVQKFIDTLYDAVIQTDTTEEAVFAHTFNERSRIVPLVKKQLKEQYPEIEEGKFLHPTTINKFVSSFKSRVKTFLSEYDLIKFISINHTPIYSSDGLSISDIERMTIA